MAAIILEEDLLASCYYNSLRLAEEHGIRTIAFPSISTGVYCFPVELAARTAVSMVVRYLRENSQEFDLIEWVLFDEYTEKDIERLVNEIDKNIKLKTGDIHPTDPALVICKRNQELYATSMKWGFKGRDQKLLTTAANASMRPVHDRMPLILGKRTSDRTLILIPVGAKVFMADIHVILPG